MFRRGRSCCGSWRLSRMRRLRRCHGAGCGGVFHIISRGFLFIRTFGTRMLLIIQMRFHPGFLTVFMPLVHAHHAARRRPQHAMVVRQMPANSPGGSIFKTPAGFGMAPTARAEDSITAATTATLR